MNAVAMPWHRLYLPKFGWVQLASLTTVNLIPVKCTDQYDGSHAPMRYFGHNPHTSL